jgi:aldose 1-epimerase
MSYQVEVQQQQAATGLDGTLHILTEAGVGVRAEIWPALGFNCYRWQVGRAEILYADPQLFTTPVPTRSGIPILFPFPNRLRDGRYRWEGRDYQLPLNSANKNAIHGFACRHPWRVIGQGADFQGAWLQGEFHATADAPESRALWPADYRLRATYRLAGKSLQLEMVVENLDTVPLPFGLGLHPWFRVPPLDGQTPEECWIEAPARCFWELTEGLPTGQRRPVDAGRDLNQPRLFTALSLDDVLTDLEPAGPLLNGLRRLGRLTVGRQPGAAPGLEVFASPAFREVVVFTPPHRRAFCLEPYTCTTDAINLQARGLDAGLRVLAPGETWSAVVQLVWRDE